MNTLHRRAARVAALAVVATSALLAGCAVQWRNAEPARELARAAEPPGSLYGGWRVYQQRCAGCHGSAADGAGGAPNLLLRLQGLGPQRFVDLVLRRYEADMLPPGQGSPREALVDEIVERRRGTLAMPAWQGEPVVNAHVMDLYAYLAARSEGRLAAGRPPAR
jgi:mono/diheme cytochrome c family protein